MPKTVATPMNIAVMSTIKRRKMCSLVAASTETLGQN